ncbi:hypothetical protein [Bdellovibrio bacteriovorus]|uniref:DUF3972 domain-containing protein n=1 Tax=Bdellovibrio bacteriovorus TaxID=959 RepID=A0A150WWQ4_BDEBC|nr:hypothetical protein [Bdellovibrio bacteriovorus]KYG68943.1 hypothetical protein AZI87_06875 [Bdellovibrio bacteriovorus]KYG70839.1 hypothetical protein AZI85_02600 [Bdellovibrio bacteriovorus]
MNVEATGSWLPLTDYSTKYKISVSTLRRRIKADDIKFRFEDGKYFIMDEPMGTHQRVHRPSQDSDALVGAHHGMMKGNDTMSASSKDDLLKAQDLQDKSMKANKDEPILTAANKLLNELKKAYTQILQDKEETILQLKDEVADLKTLVRVLESENDRLKGFKQ